MFLKLFSRTAEAGESIFIQIEMGKWDQELYNLY